MRRLTTVLSGTAAFLLCSFTAHSELIHRYTFELDASDSVGTAHGTLAGGAAVQNGGVLLDPGLDSHVVLPPEILGDAEAVTIEAWATFGASGNWARLFDFGDHNPDIGDGVGRNYIMFTPRSGEGDTRMSISDADPGYNNENVVIVPGNLENQEAHVVAVFDPPSNSMRMYVNGELAGYRNGPTIPLSGVTDLLNYLGRSLYTPDAYLNGQINEFRIYDHAFSAFEARESFQEGMATYTPRTTPTPESLQLTVPAIYLGNTVPVTITGTYGASTLDITGEPGITLESSDTAILSINDAGQLVANALGTADITVSFQGQQQVVPLQVSPVPVPQAVIQHRYPFNEASSEFMAEDVVGDADGTLFGFAFFNDMGEVDLINGGTEAGYVDLPNGIISTLGNASFEMWVTFDAELGNWQRIFDFGNSSAGEDLQGTGTSYIFFSPRTGGAGPWRFEVKTPETPAYFWEGPGTLPPNVEHHVAITYNVVGNVSKVFIDGVLMAEGTAPIPLSEIDDVNNWLGRSQFPDAGFDGRFDEFRIYEGVLTELQVAINQAAGPETFISDPGTLQAITIEASATELGLEGLPGTARILADFAEIQDVNITSVPGATFTSSDESVVTISPDGTVTPVGAGTATLTAEYNGQQTTVDITVTSAAAELALLHRYSFSEAAGSTTVEDSAGDADGTVVGNATFTGTGQLQLPGGANTSTDAGYVNLPNGMISALPDAVTFEAWVTWDGGGDWQRVWDFGNNNAGEDLQGTGDRTFFLTPQAGGANVVRAAFRPQLDAPENPVLDGNAPLPTGAQVHVAVAYDAVNGVSRLYVDGVRVDTGEAIQPFSTWAQADVNNWLGRSNWPDAFFDGSFDEFRIWSGAMNDEQAAARFAAGPDSLDEPPTEGPELTVTEEDGTLTISWPATATGFHLEQTAELGPEANWMDVTEPVSSEGGVNSVTIEPTGEARFFRLAS